MGLLEIGYQEAVAHIAPEARAKDLFTLVQLPAPTKMLRFRLFESGCMSLKVSTFTARADQNQFTCAASRIQRKSAFRNTTTRW